MAETGFVLEMHPNEQQTGTTMGPGGRENHVASEDWRHHVLGVDSCHGEVGGASQNLPGTGAHPHRPGVRGPRGRAARARDTLGIPEASFLCLCFVASTLTKVIDKSLRPTLICGGPSFFIAPPRAFGF